MTTLFSIPIYRCTSDKHKIESEKELSKALSDTGYTNDEASELYEITKQRFWNEQWYPWEYNDIIGWIQLNTQKTNVHGELWLARKKQFRRKIKDKFFYLTQASDFYVRIADDDSPNDIYLKLRTEILAIMKTPKLKNRYIDLSNFDAVAPHTDWEAITKNCQQEHGPYSVQRPR